MFYTYILRNSETNRYYVGYTKDLKKRLQLHQSGQVQSTKSNLNYKLEWYCAFKTQELALAFEKYLKTAEYCVPTGYLSYLEAKSYGCKIITFPNNPLKIDYWKEVKLLKTIPTWNEVVKIYLKLWKI